MSEGLGCNRPAKRKGALEWSVLRIGVHNQMLVDPDRHRGEGPVPPGLGAAPTATAFLGWKPE